MKLLFASDSFKGTISSEQTVEFLTKAAHEVFGPCETIGVPVADGGEGTTDAVILARKGVKVYANVHGPLMEKANAYYGKLSEKEAVLEMAQASGLPMVPEELRNPLNWHRRAGQSSAGRRLHRDFDCNRRLRYK